MDSPEMWSVPAAARSAARSLLRLSPEVVARALAGFEADDPDFARLVRAEIEAQTADTE